MSVRAKVRCAAVTNNEVQFTAVAATPDVRNTEQPRVTQTTGDFRLSIANPEDLKQFTAGSDYYVDFSSA